MVNDSAILASMHERNLRLLASNDDGFSVVDEIVLHKPGDITF